MPTCSGEYKQQLVAFLDRFKSDNGSTAAAKASTSVGSNLGSLSEADEQPENEAAEDAAAAAEAPRL